VNRSSFAVLAATLLAAAAFVWGATRDPVRAAFSYLAAFTFCLTVFVGVLLWVMIAHATSAVWFVALRRTAERVLVLAPVFAALFVPVFLWRRTLYGALGADPYSSPIFLAVRASAYFAVLGGFAFFLREWSGRQDIDAAARHTRRLRSLGSVGIPVVGLVMTFAAFDWLMALDPGWQSSVYGVYVCAGSALSGLALIAVLVQRDRSSGRLPASVGVSHLFVIGKLFIMLVLFWAYIGFCQLLLIWIADLPAENAWYLVRSAGSWSLVSGAVLVFHFALPFAALLSWRLKRSPAFVAFVAVWLLGAHYLDVYWLVFPTLDQAGLRLHWMDFAAWGALTGTCFCAATVLSRRDRPLPVNDPRLAGSLRLENG
jgi:hypothetical protein